MTGDVPLSPADLVDRGIYLIHSRNLRLGVYTGVGFIGIREKLGDRYLFQEYLRLTTPGSMGTATPLRLLGTLPEGIELEEGRSVCQTCGRPTAFDRSRGETAAERWYHPQGYAGEPHEARSVHRMNIALYDALELYELALPEEDR